MSARRKNKARQDELTTEFISVAAHQLRTPLAGIKWTLNALIEGKQGQLRPGQTKDLQDILGAIINMTNLVNDLLNVARIDEKKADFTFKKQSILPIIAASAERWKTTAKQKKIALAVRLSSQDIPLLVFDEGRITIVIDNLLDNAMKYTPERGKVRLEVRREGKGVAVSVADTGIGIPDDQLHRVFSKFFRSKNAQLTQTSGSGLGLFVAKNIVDLHGGKISFESTEGKGSIFTFTLPIS
jgi:signal transduction histidine kinase